MRSLVQKCHVRSDQICIFSTETVKNHAEFERSCCNGVREKANVNFFSNKKICQLPPLTISKNEK